MGRFYSCPFAAVAASAAQDLFEVVAAAAKPFVIHEITLFQTSDFGDAAAEGLQLLFKRATGAYTSGSGGSTVTPVKHQTGDSAAGATVEINNTTQAAAGSGALTTIRAEGWNVQGGYQYLPTPEARIQIGDAEAFVLSMSVPADAITINGTIVIEELC